MFRLIFSAGGGITLPAIPASTLIRVAYSGDPLFYAVVNVNTTPGVGDKRPEAWTIPRNGPPFAYTGGKDERAVLWTAGSADVEITLSLPDPPAAGPG